MESDNNNAMRDVLRVSPNDSGATDTVLVEPHARSKVTPRRVRQAHKKGKSIKRLAIFIFIMTAVAVGVFGYKIIAIGDKISVAERSIVGQLKDLFLKQGSYLAGEKDGRINVLLIAIGGEGHAGENLADTIMVASIDPASNKAALLSIPRDLYVQVPNRDYFSKINAVHADGEAQRKNNGAVLLSQLVGNITGLPIHYYVRVDFTAFKNLIDAVGGVNVTIPNTFFDYWHKISFPAGVEQMNGDRALAYVRARYIEGPEGGDFKRAARQQEVLLAIREKVFSVQTAFDFTRINSILNSLSDNIRTNMQLWEMKRFFEMARQIHTDQVHSVVLTTGPKGILVGGTEMLGGVPASILKTRTGDYSEIQKIAQGLLSEVNDPNISNISAPTTTVTTTPMADTPTPESSPEPTPMKEIAKPVVEIRNGTDVNGLAKRTADNLRDNGYEIKAAGNATVKGQTETSVYIVNADRADGGKVLADLLAAKLISDLPKGEVKTTADALVILGTDAQ